MGLGLGGVHGITAVLLCLQRNSRQYTLNRKPGDPPKQFGGLEKRKSFDLTGIAPQFLSLSVCS